MTGHITHTPSYAHILPRISNKQYPRCWSLALSMEGHPLNPSIPQSPSSILPLTTLLWRIQFLQHCTEFSRVLVSFPLYPRMPFVSKQLHFLHKFRHVFIFLVQLLQPNKSSGSQNPGNTIRGGKWLDWIDFLINKTFRASSTQVLWVYDTTKGFPH